MDKFHIIKENKIVVAWFLFLISLTYAFYNIFGVVIPNLEYRNNFEYHSELQKQKIENRNQENNFNFFNSTYKKEEVIYKPTQYDKIVIALIESIISLFIASLIYTRIYNGYD